MPITKKYQRYFYWEGRLYQFFLSSFWTVINSKKSQKNYAICILFATIQLHKNYVSSQKQPLSILRGQNHELVDSIDDIWLVGKKYLEALENCLQTRKLVEGLWFFVNQEKFEPKKGKFSLCVLKWSVVMYTYIYIDR